MSPVEEPSTASEAAFEAKDAYVYCSSPSRIRDLEAEAEASRKVGLEADVLKSAPLPYPTAGALRSRNQAQFNPAQYLIGLAKAAKSIGARVFEETRVTGVEDNDCWQLKVGRASIHASASIARCYGFSYRYRGSNRWHVHWHR